MNSWVSPGHFAQPRSQNVLMIILYWSEQISRNCTYLLPNKRATYTVKNYFRPMTVYRLGVDPQ